MENVLFEIAVIIVSAFVIGAIARYFKQPLILAYILTGVIIGPAGLGIIAEREFIQVVSSLGILLLLYIVGLEFNLKGIKSIGKQTVMIALGQLLLTGVSIYGISLLIGFPARTAMYFAIAMAFSSTVIGVKILSKKGQLHSLFGQLSLGVLIVQDIAAILVLFILAGFAEQATVNLWGILVLFLQGIFMSVGIFLLSYYFLGRVIKYLFFSEELVILSGLAWCFFVAMLAEYLGFSREIGAFLAGLSLSISPFSSQISIKTKVLRDFFITLFFVSLGASVTFFVFADYWLIILLFSLFALIVTPLFVAVLAGLAAFRRKNIFMTALTLGQISEFSLVVTTFGVRIGHIEPEILSIITLIAIITFTFSNYFIENNDRLFNLMGEFFKVFEFRKNFIDSKEHLPHKLNQHIVLVGCDHFGQQILEKVAEIHKDYVVIDHNPQVIDHLIRHKIPCIYGDIEDEESLKKLNIEKAKIVISSLPYHEDNLKLLKYLQEKKYEGLTFFLAKRAIEAVKLIEHGANFILLTEHLLGAYFGNMLNGLSNYLHPEKKGIPKSKMRYERIAGDKYDYEQDFADVVFANNQRKLAQLQGEIKKAEKK